MLSQVWLEKIEIKTAQDDGEDCVMAHVVN